MSGFLADDEISELREFFGRLVRSRSIGGVYIGRSDDPAARFDQHCDMPPPRARKLGFGGPVDYKVLYRSTDFEQVKAAEIVLMNEAKLASKNPSQRQKIFNSTAKSPGRKGTPPWYVYVLVWPSRQSR